MEEAIDAYVYHFLSVFRYSIFRISIGRPRGGYYPGTSDIARTAWPLSCSGLVHLFQEDKDVNRGGAMEDLTRLGEKKRTRKEAEKDSGGAARANGRLRRGP